MTDKKQSLINKINLILEDEEFNESVERIREIVKNDIAESIADGILIHNIPDQALREEVKAYFNDFFSSLNADEVTEIQEDYDVQQFGTYNEQVDTFLNLFKELRLPEEQKTQLFNSVTSISNYSLYNLMLTRTLCNAIYSCLDPVTAEQVILTAVNGVQMGTDTVFSTVHQAEESEHREFKKAVNESNVIQFDFKNNKKGGNSYE